MLADVLIQRYLGVRPITLIGFSLGARVIFYALVELAKQKAYGVVQDVILLGTTLSASNKTWCEARSVISGRFINGYARNDWVLNYLFRATSGGLATVAGLRPVENVPGLENVDVTDKIAGHMSYRAFMPLILDQLGFPVSADYFNEPEVSNDSHHKIAARLIQLCRNLNLRRTALSSERKMRRQQRRAGLAVKRSSPLRHRPRSLALRLLRLGHRLEADQQQHRIPAHQMTIFLPAFLRSQLRSKLMGIPHNLVWSYQSMQASTWLR